MDSKIEGEYIILHPKTMQPIDLKQIMDDGDVDRIAEVWNILVDLLKDINNDLNTIKRAVNRKVQIAIENGSANSSSKTHYVRGGNTTIKVVYPSSEFNASALKKLWENAPNENVRNLYLRVSEVAVNRAEFKKNNVHPNELDNKFLKKIRDCESTPNRLPTITFENTL
jgi:hypothetical protein